MLLRLFAARPPLDEPSIRWIFDIFAWGLRHLDSAVFYRHTLLVTPSNAHFPGRASNAIELAGLMFDRTLAYAGMQHWPVRLLAPGAVLPGLLPGGFAPTPLRGGVAPVASPRAVIPVGFDPALVRNPEAMIAGFAQVLAHHLGAAVRDTPPGGIENWAQTTEVLGVFLGFGLLFANTASATVSRSCGGCGTVPAQREVYLSPFDITYALALFCVLKDIPNGQVLPHLKRSLRPHFKRCRRDVARRGEWLAPLRALPGEPAPGLGGPVAIDAPEGAVTRGGPG